MNSKRALVTGVCGQDGFYLVERLLGAGYTVVGTTHRSQAPSLDPRVLQIQCDISDSDTVLELLDGHRPNEIYNLAAMSSGAGMYDDPVHIAEVNGLAVTKLLEAARKIDPSMRICQASSSEMFGDAQTTPQCELTALAPRSPYGAAKVYAHNMLRIYRERHGVFACSAILFNHESPLRRLEFVTRKVTHAAASIKLGLASVLDVGDFEARRDWGFAGDYMEALWLMLQQATARDYVVATGRTHTVRDLCQVAFGHLGLDYRLHVREDQRHARRPELVPLVGNADRARRELGWSPRTSFTELVTSMVDSDLRSLASSSSTLSKTN
jgi:GDPmannose 4,6-dehydratase